MRVGIDLDDTGDLVCAIFEARRKDRIADANYDTP